MIFNLNICMFSIKRQAIKHRLHATSILPVMCRFGLPDDSGLQSTGVVEHSATALPVTSAGAYRITTDVYVEKFKRCPLLSTTARRRSSSAVCIHLAVEICQPVDGAHLE